MLRNRFLLLITFVSGMSVMGVEISAARLVAPYFGTSIFVWTNVIGIVLVALSLGYFIGGKLADKYPTLDAVLAPLLIAGVFFLVVPWIVKPVAQFSTVPFSFSSGTAVIVGGSFVTVLLLFALPLLLLGMVSPYVIKLYQVDKENVGEMAGSVFAIGTLGSILGTFLPTLWLIPTIGTRGSLMLFAGLLVLLSSIGLSRKHFRFAAAVPVVLIPVFVLPHEGISQHPGTIFEDESSYQFMSIDESADGTRYLRTSDGRGVQSIYHPDSAETGHYYYGRFARLPDVFERRPLHVGIIGLAGGSISRALYENYGEDVTVDGVEIDRRIIDVAKEYFELEQPTLTIYNEDGRTFLLDRESEYDIVIVDAYSQQLYIPWTMTTVEFWESVKRSLVDDGIVAINVNASSEDAELLTAITNTMASVFENVYVEKMSEDSWNYMVVASREPVPLSNGSIVYFDASKTVLTDDRAPVEFMTDKMLFDYLSGE